MSLNTPRLHWRRSENLHVCRDFAVPVTAYWDRHTRFWLIQQHDGNGNQLGAAFCPNRGWLDSTARMLDHDNRAAHPALYEAAAKAEKEEA